MHRLLGNHDLYCTICDRNNGDCDVHNATKLLGLENQKYPFTPKPYEVDKSNPFHQYDPDHPLRALRRSVPKCPGQRNAYHRLGG